jgi:hypothetical protein
MATKYTNCRNIDQWTINIPTSSIARPSKIYPNWDFRFENKPSGNPAGARVSGKSYDRKAIFFNAMKLI